MGGRRGRRGREWRLPRGRMANATLGMTSGTGGGQGLLEVGNATLSSELYEWLEARHGSRECNHDTPVWFAPFSPNGIGNKLMAMVMAFHMAISEKRALVVTDWPPSTLDTTYKLHDIMRPSSCQSLFDGDITRPTVAKCTIVACPLQTRSQFKAGRTQLHWAHQSPAFLEVPRVWAGKLDWLQWWRALSQYLFQPGQLLLDGLADTLSRTQLLCSPMRSSAPPMRPSASGGSEQLRRASADARRRASHHAGFAARFAAGVAHWGEVRRPLVGVHVRMGDGCDDDKRGGCKCVPFLTSFSPSFLPFLLLAYVRTCVRACLRRQSRTPDLRHPASDVLLPTSYRYVRSFASAVTRLREAGITSGTIYLATDREQIAREAVAEATAGFDVVALGQVGFATRVLAHLLAHLHVLPYLLACSRIASFPCRAAV